MKRATRRIKLNSMPYDKFVDGHFIHATGFEVLVDGEWLLEYEGEEFEDTDDCKVLVNGEWLPEYKEEEEEE